MNLPAFRFITACLTKPVVIMLFYASIIFLGGCAARKPVVHFKDMNRFFKVDQIISTAKRQPVSYSEMIRDLLTAKVIYVGETHSNQRHHDIQLRIIKDLHASENRLSVGMEMFDKSYQHVLRDWSAGKLDESSFLKRSHWYANWKYPFRLYRDILLYIQEKRLTLYGLNIPFHIPSKIAIGGIDSLSEYDRSFLPTSVDTTDKDHRAYVKKIFSFHKVRGMDDFETFYQSQCVWEDVMAETITMNLSDGIMVVIAGNGHIIKHFGIPDRAYKRRKADFKTVYPAAAGSEVDTSYADYIWITPAPEKFRHMKRRMK